MIDRAQNIWKQLEAFKQRGDMVLTPETAQPFLSNFNETSARCYPSTYRCAAMRWFRIYRLLEARDWCACNRNSTFSTHPQCSAVIALEIFSVSLVSVVPGGIRQ